MIMLKASNLLVLHVPFLESNFRIGISSFNLFFFVKKKKQVEDVIFRLPRFAFEERFKEELSRSEGLGDLNPITLEGISIDEFNVFLHVLYPGPSA